MDVTHDELVMNGVSVQMKLAKDLPLVQGDRVQLLQVVVNLIISAIEAKAQMPQERATCIGQCPLSGATRKTFAHVEFFSV
jgi:C4-dicarboxylate-specific signal transduction histidine kinase